MVTPSPKQGMRETNVPNPQKGRGSFEKCDIILSHKIDEVINVLSISCHPAVESFYRIPGKWGIKGKAVGVWEEDN